MSTRVPPHRHFSDDVEPFAFHVFIPGALASGFVVSVAVVLGDVVRRIRGQRGARRRITITSVGMTAEVRHGSGAARRSLCGLRHRNFYVLVGALALALAVAAAPGATWNFLQRGGYLSDIAWIWVLCMLAVLASVVVAVQALRLVPQWVPVAAALVGVGAIIRFAVGPEQGTVAAAALVVISVLTTAVVALTWRGRSRATPVGVPGSVRPLLVSTPFGRECRSAAGLRAGDADP